MKFSNIYFYVIGFLIFHLNFPLFAESQCTNESMGESSWIVGELVDNCYKQEFLIDKIPNWLSAMEMVLVEESIEISDMPLFVKSLRQWPMLDQGYPGVYELVRFKATDRNQVLVTGFTYLFSGLLKAPESNVALTDSKTKVRSFSEVRRGSEVLIAPAENKWHLVLSLSDCIQCLLAEQSENPLSVSPVIE